MKNNVQQLRPYKLIPIKWLQAQNNLNDRENEIKELILQYKKVRKKIYLEMQKELTEDQIGRLLASKNHPNMNLKHIPQKLINTYIDEFRKVLKT